MEAKLPAYNLASFKFDFQLIVSNAKQYNGASSIYYKCALKMNKTFDNMLAGLTKTQYKRVVVHNYSKKMVAKHLDTLEHEMHNLYMTDGTLVSSYSFADESVRMSKKSYDPVGWPIDPVHPDCQLLNADLAQMIYSSSQGQLYADSLLRFTEELPALRSHVVNMIRHITRGGSQILEESLLEHERLKKRKSGDEDHEMADADKIVKTECGDMNITELLSKGLGGDEEEILFKSAELNFVRMQPIDSASFPNTSTSLTLEKAEVLLKDNIEDLKSLETSLDETTSQRIAHRIGALLAIDSAGSRSKVQPQQAPQHQNQSQQAQLQQAQLQQQMIHQQRLQHQQRMLQQPQQNQMSATKSWQDVQAQRNQMVPRTLNLAPNQYQTPILGRPSFTPTIQSQQYSNIQPNMQVRPQMQSQPLNMMTIQNQMKHNALNNLANARMQQQQQVMGMSGAPNESEQHQQRMQMSAGASPLLGHQQQNMMNNPDLMALQFQRSQGLNSNGVMNGMAPRVNMQQFNPANQDGQQMQNNNNMRQQNQMQHVNSPRPNPNYMGTSYPQQQIGHSNCNRCGNPFAQMSIHQIICSTCMNR